MPLRMGFSAVKVRISPPKTMYLFILSPVVLKIGLQGKGRGRYLSSLKVIRRVWRIKAGIFLAPLADNTQNHDAETGMVALILKFLVSSVWTSPSTLPGQERY